MKTATTTLIVFLLFSLHAIAKCPWELNVRVYNNGSQVFCYDNLYTSYIQALILPTDSVIIELDAIFGGSSCSNYIIIMRNSDTLTELYTEELNYKLSDTGSYNIWFYNNGTTGFWNRTFEIAYFQSTGINSIAEDADLQFYPSYSTGIFKIKHDQPLKNIFITDNAGRVVFETMNNFSEINLTKFSSGIYYYTITDENNKVWRGK